MNLNTYNLDKIYKEMTAKPANQRREKRALRSFNIKFNLNHLLAAIFIFGMLIGTIMIRNSDNTIFKTMQTIVGSYIERRQNASFLGVAAATYSSLFVILILLFVCGFCTISQPIIFCIPFFKGLGYGFSIGMLYAQYGIAAIRYVSVLLLPVMLMGTCLLILACRASLLMSISLFRLTVYAEQQTNLNRVQRYCIKYIFFTIICLVISVIDAILFYKFGGVIIP